MNKFFKPVAAGLLLMVMAASLLTRRPTTAVLAGIDGSGSANIERVQRYLGYLDGMVDALPARCRVHLFRFGADVSEFYNAAPQKSSDLWAAQDKELRPASDKRGTRADWMLERAAVELERAPESRLGLVLIWDGENTGHSLEDAVKRLADHSRLQAVLVLGATPLHRTWVRDQLNPLGSRLVLCGNHDVDAGIQQFKTLLKQRKGESS